MWPKRLQRADPPGKRRSPSWPTPLLVGSGIPLFGLALVVHAAGVLSPHTAWIAVALVVHVIGLVFHYRLRLRQEDRLDRHQDRLDRLAESAIKEGLGQAAKLCLAELDSPLDR